MENLIINGKSIRILGHQLADEATTSVGHLLRRYAKPRVAACKRFSTYDPKPELLVSSRKVGDFMGHGTKIWPFFTKS